MGLLRRGARVGPDASPQSEPQSEPESEPEMGRDEREVYIQQIHERCDAADAERRRVSELIEQHPVTERRRRVAAETRAAGLVFMDRLDDAYAQRYGHRPARREPPADASDAAEPAVAAEPAMSQSQADMTVLHNSLKFSQGAASVNPRSRVGTELSVLTQRYGPGGPPMPASFLLEPHLALLGTVTDFDADDDKTRRETLRRLSWTYEHHDSVFSVARVLKGLDPAVLTADDNTQQAAIEAGFAEIDNMHTALGQTAAQKAQPPT